MCKRRRIQFKDLVLGIAVSPWASEDTFEEVNGTWAKVRDLSLPVAYDLRSSLTPNLDDLKSCGWGPSGDE